jgi:hypothetical protein
VITASIACTLISASIALHKFLTRITHRRHAFTVRRRSSLFGGNAKAVPLDAQNLVLSRLSAFNVRLESSTIWRRWNVSQHAWELSWMGQTTRTSLSVEQEESIMNSRFMWIPTHYRVWSLARILTLTDSSMPLFWS